MHGLWLSWVVAPSVIVHRIAIMRMTELLTDSLVASSYGKVLQV